MNRAELIAKMAADAGISKAAAERALGAFVDGVAGALSQGWRKSFSGWIRHFQCQ
jgi:DNA-binding protein HU-beta